MNIPSADTGPQSTGNSEALAGGSFCCGFEFQNVSCHNIFFYSCWRSTGHLSSQKFQQVPYLYCIGEVRKVERQICMTLHYEHKTSSIIISIIIQILQVLIISTCKICIIIIIIIDDVLNLFCKYHMTISFVDYFKSKKPFLAPNSWSIT